MPFTDQNDLETPTEGQGDWDSSLNSNVAINERGYHNKYTAAEDIGSGEIIWVASGSLAHLYNSASLDLRRPSGMAYKTVNSGEAAAFVVHGVVSSVGVWSGHLVVGEPVFVDPTSPGFPVSSYSAAAFPAGIAIADDTIFFNPSDSIHEPITHVQSLGELVAGSSHFFTADIGHAGFVRRFEFISNSVDAWSGEFYSGSAQVTSESLFSVASINPGSSSLQQDTTWGYRNTDVASPGLIFGTVTVESGSGVGSGHVNISIHAERLR